MSLQSIADCLRDDGEIQAVIITGSGSEFFSMGILNPAVRATYTKEQILEMVRLANRLYDAIEALPQIVIVALNGIARAGAAELSLACDIRLAASHATWALPEALWGGFPGAGAPCACRRSWAGRARLRSAGPRDRRCRMGGSGCCRSTPGSGCSPKRGGWPRASPQRPDRHAGAKRIMNVRAAGGFAAARALSDALRHELEWSRDVDEGMAAHREGRAPRFTGR